MSDFELARETISEVRDYNVLSTRYENGATQRRLVDANPLIGFTVASPSLTYAQMQVHQNFYDSKYGSATPFTFTSPFDGVEYSVVYKKGSFKTSYSKGLFKVKFQLEIVL